MKESVHCAASYTDVENSSAMLRQTRAMLRKLSRSAVKHGIAHRAQFAAGMYQYLEAGSHCQRDSGADVTYCVFAVLLIRRIAEQSFVGNSIFATTGSSYIFDTCDHNAYRPQFDMLQSVSINKYAY